MLTKLTRRSLIQKGTALAGALAMPALLTRNAFGQDQNLYVNSWGGTYTDAERDAFYTKFEEETGVRVEGVTPVSFAKFKAQVQSGSYDFDLVSTNAIEYQQGIAEGLLEPVNTAVFDASKLPEGVAQEFGVKSFALSTCLCYRTDVFAENAPRTWADFWDVARFPGRRAMIDRSYTALGIALIADGVAPEDVYPLDIDRAFRKMDEIKPHITAWWNQGTQSQQLIRDGEVDLMPIWNGRGQEMVDAGEPMALSWEGNEVFMSWWMVAKGTPRAELAWKFIDLASRPEQAAIFGAKMFYGPGNTDAYQFLDAETAAKLPTSPENSKSAFEADTAWLIPNLAAINERWLAWQAS